MSTLLPTSPDLASPDLGAETLRAIVEAAVDAVVVIDSAGLVRFFNPAAERLFGRAAAEVVGENVSRLMPGAFAREHDRYLADYMAGGRPRIIGKGREVAGLRADGETVPLDLAVSEIRSAGGERLFVGFLRDIRDRKRAEAERVELLRAAFDHQKLEALGTLAGGVAHDVNNVIASIMAQAEYALSALAEGQGERAGGALDDILTACGRAAQIVRQVLTFASGEDGLRDIVDLGELANEVGRLLRSSAPPRVAIAVEAGTTCLAVAEAIRIHQLLVNLGVNAIHAIGDGRGRVTLGVERVDLEAAQTTAEPAAGEVRLGRLSAGAWARLRVADTGSGMCPEVMERMFEPFFTTRRGRGGTGLGLASAQAIVFAHRGAIHVSSLAGIGSTFDVYLPLVGNPALDDSGKAVPRAQGGVVEVLFVDGEESVLRRCSADLLRYGFVVSGHTGARTALELFGAEPSRFAAAVIDMSLPSLPARRMADELRALRPGLPILMCAGADCPLQAEGAETLVAGPKTARCIAEALTRLLEQEKR